MASESADRRRAQIMSITEDFICELGYDRTTVEHIIRHVGIAKGTFYHHFRSKEEVLDAIIVDILGEMRSKVERIVAHEQYDAVVKMNMVFQYFWKETFRRKRLWDCIQSKENMAFHARFDEALARLLVPAFMGIIRQGAEEGTFDVPDVFVAANAVLGTTFFTPREKLDMYEYDPGPDYVFHNCQTIERILGAEKGALRNCLMREVVLFDPAKAWG